MWRFHHTGMEMIALVIRLWNLLQSLCITRQHSWRLQGRADERSRRPHGLESNQEKDDGPELVTGFVAFKAD